MKYVLTIVSAALLSSCSLIPFLGGKLAADTEIVCEAAKAGMEAGINAADQSISEASSCAD